MGITDLSKIYDLTELASGDVMFAATGVTDGGMLQGIRKNKGFITTQSIIMRSKTGTVRTVLAEHYK
jgi:fructose-1,6-bisphosphatase II / sedoheptulose-1,7-bisphosphatase